MAFYHSPRQIDRMGSPADTYSSPVRTVPQKVGRVGRPSEKVLVAEWLSNHEPFDGDAGWWCWEGARTCLFADGQAAYHDAREVEPANDGLPDCNLTKNGIKGRDVSPRS
jgi:hypothetical protein